MAQMLVLPGRAQQASALLSPSPLAHRHPWVQLAASRFLGRALGAADPKATGAGECGTLLRVAGGAFPLFQALSGQISGAGFDEKIGEQVLAIENHVDC